MERAMPRLSLGLLAAVLALAAPSRDAAAAQVAFYDFSADYFLTTIPDNQDLGQFNRYCENNAVPSGGRLNCAPLSSLRFTSTSFGEVALQDGRLRLISLGNFVGDTGILLSSHITTAAFGIRFDIFPRSPTTIRTFDGTPTYSTVLGTVSLTEPVWQTITIQGDTLIGSIGVLTESAWIDNLVFLGAVDEPPLAVLLGAGLIFLAAVVYAEKSVSQPVPARISSTALRSSSASSR